ncbi:MAG: hypothetical protein CR974_04090 [Gammaproteobacteria bacterium]|nr:MAG: hypothetical protein CR974_04090 [Gammaproteobacteria bacterium]
MKKIIFDSDGFATDSGLVNVFVTNSDGIYLHETEEYVSEGTGLPDNMYLDAPPPAKADHVIIRASNGWKYLSDHRGQTYYRTDNGESCVINRIGEVDSGLTEQPRPSPYHTWDGETWHIAADRVTQQLADAKTEKLSILNLTAEQFVDNLTQAHNTPEFERATWGVQREEALAWFADNNAHTPTLDSIAAIRGVPSEVLRQKAYEKAMAYQAVIVTVTGQRQRFEDDIEAATSMAELEAIDIAFNLMEDA